MSQLKSDSRALSLRQLPITELCCVDLAFSRYDNSGYVWGVWRSRSDTFRGRTVLKSLRRGLVRGNKASGRLTSSRFTRQPLARLVINLFEKIGGFSRFSSREVCFYAGSSTSIIARIGTSAMAQSLSFRFNDGKSSLGHFR